MTHLAEQLACQEQQDRSDRAEYEREHRMNSQLITDNALLRAVHQDDKAKIARLSNDLREAYQISHYGRGSMQDVDDVLERAVRLCDGFSAPKETQS